MRLYLWRLPMLVAECTILIVSWNTERHMQQQQQNTYAQPSKPSGYRRMRFTSTRGLSTELSAPIIRVCYSAVSVLHGALLALPPSCCASSHTRRVRDTACTEDTVSLFCIARMQAMCSSLCANLRSPSMFTHLQYNYVHTGSRPVLYRCKATAHCCCACLEYVGIDSLTLENIQGE